MTPRDAFVRACALDVAVRKPGNVSHASPGHGMQAAQFEAAAHAAAPALFEPGASVGARIDGAVRASVAAAGCNANLGIVLLVAPLAAALERTGARDSEAALRGAVEPVLAALDRADAAAAFRAIAHANPGGLGSAPREDVHAAPTLGLRDAMALAAARDSIARQYANGYADLFDSGLPHCRDGVTPAAVLRVYLGFLAGWPDSHIVRKHGEAAAQIVMSAAQRTDPRDAAAIAAWDRSLKAAHLNPGTSADLTVATLFVGLLWHGT